MENVAPISLDFGEDHDDACTLVKFYLQIALEQETFQLGRYYVPDQPTIIASDSLIFHLQHKIFCIQVGA